MVATIMEFGNALIKARPHLIPALNILRNEDHSGVMAAARVGLGTINIQRIRGRLQGLIGTIGTLRAAGIPLPGVFDLSRLWALKFSRGLGDIDAFGASVLRGERAFPARLERRLVGRRMGRLLGEMVPPGGGNRYGKRLARIAIGGQTGHIIRSIK
jgi:hypothetical protein